MWGESSGSGWSPSQRVSNEKSVSMPWRHHTKTLGNVFMRRGWCKYGWYVPNHYSDVIMRAKASQVSDHQPHDCFLNGLFRRRSKKTSKLRVTGFGAGNSPVTDEFSAQRASNAENVSIWWRHHDVQRQIYDRSVFFVKYVTHVPYNRNYVFGFWLG